MENIIIPMEFGKDKKKPTYNQVVDIDCPYEAIGNRIIIIHVESDEGRKKKSDIYIPEHIKKSMEAAENFIVPGVVKSIGKAEDGRSPYDNAMPDVLEVNDIVYTYPGGYEAKLTVNDIEYLVFSRRDILLKVK